MERIIKFRAWNEATKEMLYNDELSLSDAIENHNAGIGMPLMQFTGLLDKNGKEIYEGDVIATPSEDYEYCIVEWMDNYAAFQINGYGYDMHYGEGSQEVYDNHISMVEDNVLVFPDDELEVIGNIHSNPELLQQ